MHTTTDSLPVQAPPRFSVLVVNLFFVATILFLFRDVLFNTRVLTSLGGDGTKNLYTFLYHILYEKGTWFHGMNYPYGEHLVFTDAQPLFSIPLSYLNTSLHFSIHTMLAFMYWMIAFSFLLGLNFTYRILLHFRVHYLMAAACSACIITLSPQVVRIIGHYPLAFVSFLPMLFFWTIRYNETDKKRYLIYLFLTSVVYAFLHMYFLAMSLVWTAGYFIGFWLSRNPQVKNKWKHSLFFVLSNVLAIGTLQVFLKLTDPVTDRPVIPHGSVPADILRPLFTTNKSPFWEAIEHNGLIASVDTSSEGAAYMGFAMMIMIVVGGVTWGIRILKRKHGPSMSFPAVWVLLALATLVFAIGIDHIWDINFLKGILRPFRQFRVPERFSWVFYYVMSVYTAVGLYSVCRYLYQRSAKIVAYFTGFAVVSIWALEAIGNMKGVHEEAGPWQWNYETFMMTDGDNWTKFLNSHQLKSNDLDCILTVPYMHIGSEKLWLNEDRSFAFLFAFSASLQTGLPIMDVLMSRSSWGQTFAQARISAGLIPNKPVLERMKNDRVLLMHYTEFELDPDEKEIISCSDYIGNFEHCNVYVFYPARLLEKREAYTAGLKTVASAQHAADSVYGDKRQCFIEHFEQNKAPYYFAGSGAMPAIQGNDSLIAIWQAPAGIDSMQYEFAGWARFTDVDAGYCFFTLIFKDAVGRELHRFDALGKASVDNAPGYWFRLNRFFKMPGATATVEIRIRHNSEKSYFALDELLLRPVNTTVISKMSDGTVLANGHVLIKGGDRK